jgi:hypothetical protein
MIAKTLPPKYRVKVFVIMEGLVAGEVVDD